MRLARLVGTALVAIIGVSAILASTAAAIPKFVLPIVKRGVTATVGVTDLRVPSQKVELQCTSGVATGVIVDDDEMSGKVHFLGCSAFTNGKGPCTIKNPGGAGGLILTELITALLGLLHEPNGAAGLLFRPGPGAAGVFAIFAAITKSTECEEKSETAVEGSIAAEFAPTGKKSADGKVALGPVSPTGKQKITLILVLSGIVKPKLTTYGGSLIESTLELSSLLTFEEEIEVT